MKERFSLFAKIWSTTPIAEIGVEEMYEIVKSDALKPYTDMVRSAETKEEKDKAKGHLPNVTLNGVFKKRGNANLEDYSGLTCLDFDHIPEDSFTHIKECLRNWAQTLFLFTSPSGDGLKLVIRHSLEDPAMHWNLYGHITKQFKEEFGCEWIDTCTKDIQRSTYLCYDPGCFYNPDAEIYPYEYDAEIVQQKTISNVSQAKKEVHESPMTPEMQTMNDAFQVEWKDKSLINYIDKHQWSAFPEDYQEGNRNNSLMKKAGQLYRCGVEFECAVEKLVHLYSHTFSDYPEQEVRDRVEYIYKHSDVHDFGLERMWWFSKKNGAKKRQVSSASPV